MTAPATPNRRARRLIAAAALSTTAALVMSAAAHDAASAADAPGGPLVRAGSGPKAEDIKAFFDQYRADLGGGTTAGANGSFGGVRREINWDGVPDQFAAPNDLPNDFFNKNSPRGAVFSTPGSSVLVSAKTGAKAPVRFGDINASYVNEFGAFTPERIFTAAGSTVTDVTFFVPGTQNKASVKGFGVVFTDVDSAESTSIEYYGADGASLYKLKVPATPGKATFSFAGATFDSARIAKVRITAGTALLSDGVDDGSSASRDKVAMDDFIYSEPVVITEAPTSAAAAATPTTPAAPVSTAAVAATSAPAAAPTTKAASAPTTKKATKTTKKAAKTTKRR